MSVPHSIFIPKDKRSDLDAIARRNGFAFISSLEKSPNHNDRKKNQRPNPEQRKNVCFQKKILNGGYP
jgi:hypothetical protein